MVHENFVPNFVVVLLNQTPMFVSYPFVGVATGLAIPALNRLEYLEVVKEFYDRADRSEIFD